MWQAQSADADHSLSANPRPAAAAQVFDLDYAIVDEQPRVFPGDIRRIDKYQAARIAANQILARIEDVASQTLSICVNRNFCDRARHGETRFSYFIRAS